MDKTSLRREVSARVRALTWEERARRSAEICSLLEAGDLFGRATSIFTFVALPSEPDLGPLLALHPGKRWVIPRVADSGELGFHEVRQFGEALPGAHRFSEPDPLRHPEVSPDRADLVLVPGLAFDPASRARLGRGKGHYDRFLSRVLAANASATFVGIAFSSQLTQVPVESHDISMHRILTEEGWV